VILLAHPEDPSAPRGRSYIGFWRSAYFPDLPDPEDFLDEGWNDEERARVALYLQCAEVAESYRGSSKCRICGKSPLGSRELSDGIYRWPEGLAHYLTAHAVRPPEKFLEHVRRIAPFGVAAYWSDGKR